MRRASGSACRALPWPMSMAMAISICCCAARGRTARPAILLNDGTGQFAAGETLAEHVACASFGDLDNDGDVDLWLGRWGADQVWLNDGQGHFTLSPAEGIAGPDVLTRLARLADMDSDGDLDLLAFRCAAGQIPATGGEEQPAASSVYFSNTDGSFVDRAADLGLQLAETSVAAVAYDDFDNDLDLDLIVFPHQGPAVAWMNFRVGQHRIVPGDRIGLGLPAVTSVTTGDPDKDGDRDLLIATPEGLRLFAERRPLRFRRTGRRSRRAAAVSEAPAASSSTWTTTAIWISSSPMRSVPMAVVDRRCCSTPGPTSLLWMRLRLDPGNLLGTLRTDGDASCVAADFTGDGRCDLLLAPLESAGTADRECDAGRTLDRV